MTQERKDELRRDAESQRYGNDPSEAYGAEIALELLAALDTAQGQQEVRDKVVWKMACHAAYHLVFQNSKENNVGGEVFTTTPGWLATYLSQIPCPSLAEIEAEMKRLKL